GVYFVLGCCLFSSLPYGQVLRELTAGLEGALAGAGWRVPASTALTEVRRRVGEEPLKVLLGRVAGALSAGRAEWWRVGPGRCSVPGAGRCGARGAGSRTWPGACWGPWARGCCCWRTATSAATP